MSIVSDKDWYDLPGPGAARKLIEPFLIGSPEYETEPSMPTLPPAPLPHPPTKQINASNNNQHDRYDTGTSRSKRIQRVLVSISQQNSEWQRC